MVSVAAVAVVLVAHAHLVLEFSKFDSELPCNCWHHTNFVFLDLVSSIICCYFP
jgi:hypothetical protein